MTIALLGNFLVVLALCWDMDQKSKVLQVPSPLEFYGTLALIALGCILMISEKRPVPLNGMPEHGGER